MPIFALAADIGGTKIAVARVSRSGRISHLLETDTPAAGGYHVIDTVARLLGKLPRDGVRAVAVCVPGLAYPDGHVWAPNIAGWKYIPLGTCLRKQLRLPVYIESDRNAFVLGEAWRGVARGCRDVVFLAVGTGIGAGILAGGNLVRGHGDLAGSVGWMAVRDQFLPLYSRVGCLEAQASGPGLSATARSLFEREMSALEVTQLARRGDRTAKKLLGEAGYYLGVGIANLVSVLNPEVVVIGGGVSMAGNLLLAPARAAMKRWAQPLAVKQVSVLRSRLGMRASLLGLAKIAFGLCGGAPSKSPLQVRRRALRNG